MANRDLITNEIALREIPLAGGGGVKVIAGFDVDPRLNISTGTISLAARMAEGAIWNAISEAAGRAYAQSGLRVISGNLKTDAMNSFVVSTDVIANEITVTAEWFPTLSSAYFFIQMFGHPGFTVLRDKATGKFTRRRKNSVVETISLPPRPFVAFDQMARHLVAAALNQSLASLLVDPPEQKPGQVPKRPPAAGIQRKRPPRIQPSTPTAAALERRAAPGLSSRLSPFKARKLLRGGAARAGVLSAQEARSLVDVLVAAGLSLDLAIQMAGQSRATLIKTASAFQIFFRGQRSR